MVKKSCKGSPCIAILEMQIDEISPHQESRNEKMNKAIVKAQNLTLEELKKKARELKAFKTKIPADVDYPTALQMSIDEKLEEALAEVEKNLKLALELANLQTRYEIEILWYIYLCKLKKDAMAVGEINVKSEKPDMTGPEMVKKLVEMLMLNREQDKAVIQSLKDILISWEASNETV